MNLEKLEQNQRYALFGWLIKNWPRLADDMSFLCRFDEFCDGKISEWRIIYAFGLAGKIWFNCGRIHISGHSAGEMDGFKGEYYLKEQEEIKALNKELELLLLSW